jgi:hypothetical protein
MNTLMYGVFISETTFPNLLLKDFLNPYPKEFFYLDKVV